MLLNVILFSVGALILFYGLKNQLSEFSKKIDNAKRAHKTMKAYKMRKECQKLSHENSYMQ